MTRGQLAAICRMIELPTVGTKTFLAFSIEMRLRNLKADDRVIRREGVENMTTHELQQASKERGMRALGSTKEQLVKQLKEWLDLSLNAKVPPSLLLLSRTLYLPQSFDPVAQLAATMSTLPESAASRATAEIASKEGKTRNVVKLELIKEEQKKIEEEAREEKVRIENEIAENEKREKALQAKLDEESIKPGEETIPLSQTVMLTEFELKETSDRVRDKETIIDVAPVIRDTTASKVLEDEKLVLKIQEDIALKELKIAAENIKPAPVPIKERELSSEDFADLKTAIEKLGKVKSGVETVDEIKKELEDYKEDLEDLQTVRQIVDRSGLKESKGAQRLFSKVNKMLRKVDSLAVKTKEKKTDAASEVSEDDLDLDANLVTVNELIKAVQTSGAKLDTSKVEAMVEVMSHSCKLIIYLTLLYKTVVARH